MYYYNEHDRKNQLERLKSALGQLVVVSRKLNLSLAPDYENALAITKTLLANGFTQPQLTELSRSVPDIVERHKDWESGVLVQKANGSWEFPAWFEELEASLQPAREAAGVLAVLGYY